MHFPLQARRILTAKYQIVRPSDSKLVLKLAGYQQPKTDDALAILDSFSSAQIVNFEHLNVQSKTGLAMTSPFTLSKHRLGL